MFIVWRKRDVKGDTRALFLQDLPTAFGEGAVTPWKPMHCEHRGAGRVARTPLAMHSGRRDGKPRQELLWRLPTIRSCCIADRLHRAAWWFEVDHIVGLWERGIWSNALVDIRRDRRSILARLREVVPPPTPAGVRDFAAYRMEKERAYQARMARFRAEAEAFYAEQGRREEEARRRAWEQRRAEDQRAWQDWGSQRGEWSWQSSFRDPQSPFGAAARPDCFAVLGLSPDATTEQVKGRYRDLAKQHHPDRGGDAEQFMRVQTAYEQASAILERRTPA